MTKQEILEQLAAKQREYIEFMTKHGEVPASWAYVHGWRCPDSVYQLGVLFREEIAQLEKDVEKLSDPVDYVRGIAKISPKDRTALVEKLNKRTSSDWVDAGNFYLTIEGGDLFLNFVTDDGEYEHDWWLKPTVKFETV